MRHAVLSSEKWKTRHSERRKTRDFSKGSALEKTLTAGPSRGSTTSRITKPEFSSEKSAPRKCSRPPDVHCAGEIATRPRASDESRTEPSPGGWPAKSPCEPDVTGRLEKQPRPSRVIAAT